MLWNAGSGIINPASTGKNFDEASPTVNFQKPLLFLSVTTTPSAKEVPSMSVKCSGSIPVVPVTMELTPFS